MNLSFQRLCLGVRIMQHFIMLERPISSRPTFLWMDQLDCPLKRDCRINFLWARSVKSFSCPLRGISLYWKCESEKATSGWQGLQSTEIFSHHCKACHSNWKVGRPAIYWNLLSPLRSMSQQLESGKACNLLKSSLTTAKHVKATGTFSPTFLPCTAFWLFWQFWGYYWLLELAMYLEC